MLAAGVVLLVVAVVLLLVEAHVSTGGFGSAAILALVAGLVMLLLGAGASLAVVLLVAVCTAAAASVGLLLVGRSVLHVRRQLPRAGTEAMVGHVGVIHDGAADMKVFVDGGLWRARPSVLEEGRALHDGDRVVVERVNGLTLCVRKAEEWELYP
jgi:membrane-bound ClpP family serine protease